ncbi:hypothetical protein RND81_13G007400 [Saponaria officinalis]|uniref:Uncharacterized protein n=1 Tax=Saponaria officinalis TaxID=3572 RepID=A0AAW1H2Y1_SAPOF
MSTTEIELDDDVFDDSFLQEIEKLEESITSSTQHHRHNHHQPPPYKPYISSTTPLPPQPPQVHRFTASTINAVDDINYSPPRELSQRFTTTTTTTITTVGDVSVSSASTRSSRSPVTPPIPENEILKNELSRLMKELSAVKEENSLLREERDKKKQLKVVHTDSKTGSCDAEVPLAVHPRNGASRRRENLKVLAESGPIPAKTEQKSVGIQTDRGDESASPSISGTTSSFSVQPKLLTIWSSRSSRSSQRNFVAKMLETCATDFCDLFGFLGLNVTSKTVQECLTHMPLTVDDVDARSNEVTRVSQLYSVLNKLSNNIVHLNAFVDILLDLCKLENALVVHRSLRILRVAVGYLLSGERIRFRRDNVHVEKCPSDSDNERMHDFDVGKSGMMCDISGNDASFVRFAPAFGNISTAEPDAMTRIDWFHVYTSLCQTLLSMTDEHVKVEAVSIMNIIIRGMDPYSERGRFGEKCVFEAVADLLKKGTGLFCRKEAVHLVYLLLNCPSLLATFCSSCKEKGDIISENNGVENCTYQAFCAILEGFAGCILCHGHNLKELSLCRNAVLVLAFLASSGKPGLDIFLFHKLSNGGNFLGLILQVLVSEIDAEALEVRPAPEMSRERTLLMREVLILLNRLVSNPTYATSVLKVLTSSRDIVSLAIDIATRLSKKSRTPPNSDTITKQMRESEVVEWATVFKKRIVTFLRETT